MKKLLKILGILVLAVVVFVAAVIIYINSSYPDVGPTPDITVEVDSALIARGDYLANHVTVCIDCHSGRDWSKFSGPVMPGEIGMGGEGFTEEMGFPGNFYAKNITPYNLSNYTDGEIYRAITMGVTKEGEPMFPIMPYPVYAQMSHEDVISIIAYLRTLEPIEHDVPPSEASFPFSLILRTIPTKADPKSNVTPPKSDTLAYGKYMATIAACAECHTPQEEGEKIAGMEYAGGMEFGLPTGGVARSANITTDKETGIGAWSKEFFIQRFKFYEDYDSMFVDKGEYNSIMPWTMYAGMTEEDLGAIYTYLRTVKPVKNYVEKFSP